jgi:hypothetical protein
MQTNNFGQSILQNGTGFIYAWNREHTDFKVDGRHNVLCALEIRQSGVKFRIKIIEQPYEM